MPDFMFTALDDNGVRRTGVRHAPDRQSAAAALRNEELYVLELREQAALNVGNLLGRMNGIGSRLSVFVRSLHPVTTQDKIQFFREIGLMLRSGLTLLHALETFRDQCPKAALARAAGRIAERLQSGSSFSASLEKERKLFPRLAVRMIATGEASGELDVMLERVARQIEHRADLVNTLLTSLTYPALVVLITAGIVGFLVTSVIPKFMRVLAGRNLSLPKSTQFLVDASTFMNAHGSVLMGCIILGSLVFAAIYFLTRCGRYWCDRMFLSLPLIGNLLRLSLMAHFGRTFAVLLKSGVSIIDGLRLLGDSVPNAAFAVHLKSAEQDVLEGQALSKSLRSGIVSPLLLELVSVGELTGTLDSVLEEAGLFFEQRLQKRIKWMSTLFEPAMILVVGGIVGFVYISFFQVLYQLSAGR